MLPDNLAALIATCRACRLILHDMIKTSQKQDVQHMEMQGQCTATDSMNVLTLVVMYSLWPRSGDADGARAACCASRAAAVATASRIVAAANTAQVAKSRQAQPALAATLWLCDPEVPQ